MTNRSSLAVHADSVIERSAKAAHDAADAVHALAERTDHATRRRMAAVSDSAARAGAATVDTIKAKPVQSVLLAAAAGALVIGVLSLLGRRH